MKINNFLCKKIKEKQEKSADSAYSAECRYSELEYLLYFKKIYLFKWNFNTIHLYANNNFSCRSDNKKNKK